MKRIAAALIILASSQVMAAEPDAMTSLLQAAQAAAGSPTTQTLKNQLLPSTQTGGATFRGGQLTTGSVPMVVTCRLVQPNACLTEDGGRVPFEKYIIQKTGEVDFTIQRIELKMLRNDQYDVAIHFTLP